MKTRELQDQLRMSYEGQVEYLLNKYGSAKYDYFCNESCKSRNTKVSRAKEGLVCHHIDEDKAIMLSSPSYAAKNRFDYQRADRLVYCNLLEHLLLHIKIVIEPRHPEANLFERPGVGGIVNICRILNDYYGGRECKREYQKTLYEPISDNMKDYIAILIYLTVFVKTNRPDCLSVLNEKNLTTDSHGEVVEELSRWLYSPSS